MVKKLLGDAVREERLRRNLSQNSLAEQAKISLRTVSDIENYIGNPQLETLYALATYLHISIDAIYFLTRKRTRILPCSKSWQN